MGAVASGFDPVRTVANVFGCGPGSVRPDRVRVTENLEGYRKPYLGLWEDFCDKSGGACQGFKLGEKSLKLAIELLPLGDSVVGRCGRLAERLKTSWESMAFGDIASTWRKMRELFSGQTRCNSSRQILKAVSECAGAVLTGASVGLLLTENKIFIPVLSWVALLPNAITLVTASQDYMLANSCLQVNSISEGQRTMFADAKKLALLSVIKSITSLVAGAVGVFASICGWTLLSSTTLLTLGVISSAAAVYISLFKKSTQYDLPADLSLVAV